MSEWDDQRRRAVERFVRAIEGPIKKATELLQALDRTVPPEVRRRIVTTVSDPAFQAALVRYQADVETLIQLYDDSPVAFVVEGLDPAIGARLLRAAPEQRDALMLALFEQALLDSNHLDEIAEAVRRAPVLDEPQREDLLTALTMLADQPVLWAPACQLLLSGYEGALWLWAEQDRIIDEKRNMTERTVGKPSHAKGIDRILEEDGLPLPNEHRRFVRQRVFDNLANDIRHGRARVGHRECALLVLFALDGWLDQHVGSALREQASETMNRIVENDEGD